MEKLRRTLWCKKAVVDGLKGSLQNALEHALSVKDVVERSEPTSSEEKSFRVVGQYHPIGKGVAGIFVSYVSGASAVSLARAAKAKQMKLEQLQPPDLRDGARRDWAEGLVYFFCRGDFVVIIQSTTLRIRQLEEHLSWLLRKDGEPQGPSVTLLDQPAKAIKEKVRKHGVKSVTFGGGLYDHVSHADDKGGIVSASLSGRILNMIKGAVNNDDDHFKWEDSIGSNIVASVELKYNYSTTAQGQKLLNALALALREGDAQGTKLVLNNGEEIAGNQLYLTTSCPIAASENILVADSAFEAMHSWFLDIVDTKELS